MKEAENRCALGQTQASKGGGGCLLQKSILSGIWLLHEHIISSDIKLVFLNNPSPEIGSKYHQARKTGSEKNPWLC